MSTLNVSNITDGTDTVETGYVLNGSAKAWNNLNLSFTLLDSHNVSSVTDDGGGGPNTWSITLTSAMANDDYQAAATCNNSASRACSVLNTSSSKYQCELYITNSPTSVTSSVASSAIHGDLA